MTEFKTWAAGALVWLAATFPVLAQETAQQPPSDAGTPWLLFFIIAAVVLVVIGAIVSYAYRKPKTEVIVTRSDDE